MGCPLYKDYTRECASKFRSLVNFTDFEFCKSDEYKNCLFYRTIKNSKECCKFAEKCIELHLNMPTDEFKITIHDLNEMGKYYCFTENKKNCAIYKKYEKGEEVSPFLHPDGTLVAIE